MKNIPRTIAIVLAALSLASGPRSHAAPTAAVPVGYLTYPLSTGVTTAIGIPLLDLPTYTGKVTALTTNTLTTTGVTWTPGQFTAGGVRYFVTVRTGTQAGRTLLVTANTANSLTLDIEDAALNLAGFAVTTSDSFELFQGDTVGSLFGTSADGSGNLSSGLKGSTVDTTADLVQIYNGTAFVSYFYNTTTACWVQVGGGTTNQNGLVLYPDDGLLIVRRGAAANLTFLGRVPSTTLKTRLPGGTTNVIALRFPANTTLGGLNFGAPGTWITGASESVADNVNLWNGTAWDIYYKNTSNLWIKVGGSGTDQSATVITAGKAIQVVKRGTATGSAAFYTQALPYGL